MNLFILDLDPFKAAGMLCDQHVNKQILECGQILCDAARILGETDVPMKPYNVNGRFAKWAAETRENWLWTAQLMISCSGFRFFSTGKDHETRKKIVAWYTTVERFNEDWRHYNLPTTFPRSERVNPDLDIVTAYRDYYRVKASEWEAKGRPMRFTYNPKPEWI